MDAESAVGVLLFESFDGRVRERCWPALIIPNKDFIMNQRALTGCREPLSTHTNTPGPLILTTAAHLPSLDHPPTHPPSALCSKQHVPGGWLAAFSGNLRLPRWDSAI